MRTLSSWLWVHQPSAAILGSREKHVDLGDSVSARDDDELDDCESNYNGDDVDVKGEVC